MTQTPCLRRVSLSKLLRDLVDLVGIEPTTSSMPWKRAPSCATGPLFGDTTDCPLRTALSILADLTQIVNARRSLNNVPSCECRGVELRSTNSRGRLLPHFCQKEIVRNFSHFFHRTFLP